MFLLSLLPPHTECYISDEKSPPKITPPHLKRTHLFYSTTLYLIEQPAAAKSHQMCIHTQHKIFHFIPPPPVFLSLYSWWIMDRPFFPLILTASYSNTSLHSKGKKYFCIDILFQHCFGFFQSHF